MLYHSPIVDLRSGISLMVISLVSFPLQCGNGLIPYWGEIGMGFFLTTGEAGSEEKKFPHESRKAHFIFPTNGLAGVVKKNFPKSGEAASGEIFFYHNC